jgi:hypothetical protein
MDQPVIGTPAYISQHLLASALVRNETTLPLLNRMQNRHQPAPRRSTPHDSFGTRINTKLKQSYTCTSSLVNANDTWLGNAIPWHARRFQPPSELVRNRADDLPRRDEFLAGLIRTERVGVFGINSRFIKKIGDGGRNRPMT